MLQGIPRTAMAAIPWRRREAHGLPRPAIATTTKKYRIMSIFDSIKNAIFGHAAVAAAPAAARATTGARRARPVVGIRGGARKTMTVRGSRLIGFARVPRCPGQTIPGFAHGTNTDWL